MEERGDRAGCRSVNAGRFPQPGAPGRFSDFSPVPCSSRNNDGRDLPSRVRLEAEERFYRQARSAHCICRTPDLRLGAFTTTSFPCARSAQEVKSSDAHKDRQGCSRQVEAIEVCGAPSRLGVRANEFDNPGWGWNTLSASRLKIKYYPYRHRGGVECPKGAEHGSA